MLLLHLPGRAPDTTCSISVQKIGSAQIRKRRWIWFPRTASKRRLLTWRKRSHQMLHLKSTVDHLVKPSIVGHSWDVWFKTAGEPEQSHLQILGPKTWVSSIRCQMTYNRAVNGQGSWSTYKCFTIFYRLAGLLVPYTEPKISGIVCSSNMVDSHLIPASKRICVESKARTQFVEKLLSCQIAVYEAPEANSWFKQVRVAVR